VAVYTEEERELLAAALGMELNRTAQCFLTQLYMSMMETEVAKPSFLMLSTTQPSQGFTGVLYTSAAAQGNRIWHTLNTEIASGL